MKKDCVFVDRSAENQKIIKYQKAIATQTDQLLNLSFATSHVITQYGKVNQDTFALLCRIQRIQYQNLEKKLSDCLNVLGAINNSKTRQSPCLETEPNAFVSIQLATQNIALVREKINLLDTLLSNSKIADAQVKNSDSFEKIRKISALRDKLRKEAVIDASTLPE